MDGAYLPEEVLKKLQEELQQLSAQASPGGDPRALPPSKGSGPRLFCGHVPKEATEELVKAHFSRWGVVTDVYFPRHKKTLKRRPFCFVTFSNRESAERALHESPLNMCGVPIKNLTMVEDRDKYYKDKHASARSALLNALHAVGAGPAPGAGSLDGGGGPAGALALAPDQISSLAALLALEGVGADVLAALAAQQAQQVQQPYGGAAAQAAAQQQPYSAAQQVQQVQHSYGAWPARDRYSPPSGGTADMSRDSSVQSMTSTLTGADWFGASMCSSARNSLDLCGALAYQQQAQAAAAHHALLMHRGGAGVAGLPATRMSLDAAMQLKAAQQLVAQRAAAAASLSGGGGGSGMSSAFYQSAPPAAAAAASSAFYQPSSAAAAAAAASSAFYQPSTAATAVAGTAFYQPAPAATALSSAFCQSTAPPAALHQQSAAGRPAGAYSGELPPIAELSQQGGGWRQGGAMPAPGSSSSPPGPRSGVGGFSSAPSPGRVSVDLGRPPLPRPAPPQQSQMATLPGLASLPPQDAGMLGPGTAHFSPFRTSLDMASLGYGVHLPLPVFRQGGLGASSTPDPGLPAASWALPGTVSVRKLSASDLDSNKSSSWGALLASKEGAAAVRAWSCDAARPPN